MEVHNTSRTIFIRYTKLFYLTNHLRIHCALCCLPASLWASRPAPTKTQCLFTHQDGRPATNITYILQLTTHRALLISENNSAATITAGRRLDIERHLRPTSWTVNSFINGPYVEWATSHGRGRRHLTSTLGSFLGILCPLMGEKRWADILTGDNFLAMMGT